MDCREFYEVLERVMEGEPAPEALAHARHCPACAGLIEELRLIARTGRLLDEQEPAARLWEAVHGQLRAEGFIATGGWLERLWTSFGRLVPISPSPALSAVYALVLVVGLALVLSEVHTPSVPNSPEAVYNRVPMVERAAVVNGYEAELAQLERVGLQRIAWNHPELQAAYEANLATVNEAIRTCHHTLQQDPEDHSTREQLYAAYQQKAVVLQSLLDPDLGM